MPRARRHPSPGLHAVSEKLSAPPARISPGTVREIAELFALLSSESRLRILHAIALHGDMHVRRVADTVGMKIAAVSNQLRLMARSGILGARSEGLRVIYSIIDPAVTELLAAGARLRARR